MLKNTKTRRASLGLETLESRLTPTNSIVGGELLIQVGDASDTVSVNVVTNNYMPFYSVTENGRPSRLYHPGEVWSGRVRFLGNGGNDTFSNNTGLRAFAYGGAGIDVLIGGSGDDLLDGGNDRDTLHGNGGIDTLLGGNDYATNYLYGGNDNDTLEGGYGTDYLFGHGGTDVLYGRDGDDFLYGGDDGLYDQLYGGAGSDAFEQDLQFFGYALLNVDAFATDCNSEDYFINDYY